MPTGWRGMTTHARHKRIDMPVLLSVKDRLENKLAVMLDNLDQYQPDVGNTLHQLRVVNQIIRIEKASKYPTRNTIRAGAA